MDSLETFKDLVVKDNSSGNGCAVIEQTPRQPDVITIGNLGVFYGFRGKR